MSSFTFAPAVYLQVEVLANVCLCPWCFLCLVLWKEEFPCKGARTLIFSKRIEPHRDLGRRLGWISMPDCKFLLVSAGISSLTADLVSLATFQWLCTLNYLISCVNLISSRVIRPFGSFGRLLNSLCTKIYTYNWKTTVCMSSLVLADFERTRYWGVDTKSLNTVLACDAV